MASLLKELFSLGSLLTTTKAISVTFIAGLLLVGASMLLKIMPVFGAVLSGLAAIFGLFLWGYLADKFWKWD